MIIFLLSAIILLALSSFVVNLVYSKKYNKVPYKYLIIQSFITGIIANATMFFVSSATAVAYLIMLVLVEILVAIYYIFERRNYINFVKFLEETEALHKQIAKDMAEEAVGEIEQIINEE